MSVPASFLKEAQRRIHQLPMIEYVDTRSPESVNLRNSGYLEAVNLTVKSGGTYTSAGPTGVDAFLQYAGPIDRITLTANSVAVLFDCSGYMAAVINAINANYKYGVPFDLSRGKPDTFTSSPGTSAYENIWTYQLPVAIDFANLPYPLGLYQTALHSNEVQLNVRHTPIAATSGSPGSGLYVGNGGNLGSVTGGTLPHQVFFDPIGPVEAQPPISVAHTWRQYRRYLTADGDNELQIPLGGWVTRIIYQVVDGAAGALAPTDDIVTRLRLTFASNITPYDETKEEAQARAYRHYGADLPVGMFVHDFVEETHTERDIVDSRSVTDLRAIMTTSGGTYTGGAYVDIAIEELLPVGVGGMANAGL